jgi:hypothetical protein
MLLQTLGRGSRVRLQRAQRALGFNFLAKFSDVICSPHREFYDNVGDERLVSYGDGGSGPEMSVGQRNGPDRTHKISQYMMRSTSSALRIAARLM